MAATPDRTDGMSEMAALARRADPDRFLCALFAPPPLRETLFLLIAVNGELARARAAATNPMAALIRLQWWRDAVEEALAGAAPRRHEIAGPLAAALKAGQLEAEGLQGLIDAREAEAEEEMPSLAALLAHLRGSAGGFAVVAGRALGAPAAALPGLQALGAGYGMAGLLRSIPALAQQGRSLLPADLLAEQGLSPAEAARDPRLPGVKAVGQALAREGQALLREGQEKLRGVLPRAAVAAALPGRLGQRDLRRILRPDWAPGQPPPPRGAGDKLAVAWAGWRGRV